MEAALSTASWLLRKLLDKLSGNLVAAFFASSQLGTSVQGISRELLYTQGLLHTAQGSVDTDSASSSNNPGLLGLLQQLSTAADEAEDMLDELDYFLIQDELDGTNTAAMKDGVALHGGHAIHHAFGKWLPCLSCSVKHDGSSDGAASKLVFDRVGMANRITAVMGQMQPLCAAVSDLLKLNPCRRGNGLPEGALKRPMTTSLSTEDKLYGRDSIFDPLVKDMISAKYVDEKLSVLPIVGPGGIGKTTFVQHLYNDTRIQHHFQIKIWICVSVSFNVYRLTQEIFKCVPPSESEESSIRTEPTNLDQLQILLAKWLKPRRFLIVLDDIWRCDSEDEWRSFLAPFTKGETRGNVILTTTRFSCVAKIVKTVSPLKLDGLDPEEFLTFFLVCVFGESKVEHHMDLLNIGKEIIRKLKCSPLAAKTVGRLLRKDLTQEHWRRVLYNEEWGYQTGDNDIMPALKISFDYLPFHLKKCFSYCALFPEDHLFGSHQLIHLWLALGILHNRDKNMRIQEMGLYYINELVNNGFFQKYNEIETQLDYPLLFQKETTYPCYVMHDLFHELARNISSYECISVDYSSSRPMYFPQSIRHLSIVTRQEKDTEAECNDNFKEQMYKLKERIDIGNLRTLMLFGEYNTTFATIFQETFKEINGLRVLSLYAASQDFLPHNFSKLIHLRYLRIQSHSDDSILLPNTLSRFCHLKVLDLEQWEGNSSLPTDMSRLRNLCFFHAGKELHFNIPNVGKLMFLQELKKFHVKKESTGFGLQELAGLKELGGSLTLQNLENVKTKREADEAKLMLKKNITELKLIWDSNRPQKEPAIEADILESLQPHPNIKHLCIKNNGSRDCPTWLRSNICIQMLQSLHLQGISWTRLPPFGQIPHLKKLKLENIACMDQFGEAEFSHLSNQSFRNLKVIVFHSMPEFKKWSSGDYCNLFNGLEALEISKCPKLNELPFTTSLDSTTQDSQSMFWFQNLHKLVIDDCPQLLPLAPLPHTAALEHVQFRTDDSDVLYTNGGLTVSGETRSWEVRSSAQQQKVHYHEYCPMSVKDLQKLIPLKILRVVHCGKVLIKEMVVGFTSISVECLDLTKCCISGKELSVMLNYLPNVSHLFIDQCPNITRMSSKQSEDDKAEDDEGLLQLLPKLSKLLSNISIEYCENLTLCAHHGGIQEFVPLQSLTMSVCEVLFPCWPIDGDIFNPFPSTLKQLYLRQISSMESMAPLSSLTSLTHLEIVDCENVKMDGFDPLILQNLKKLVVYNRDDQYSIAANIMSRATNMILEKTRLMLTNTFKLEELVVDSISAVLLAPLCIHLSDSLHMLSLSYDHGRRQIESFTQEQEQAFLKLTSLRQLHFVSCKGIHSLPVGLQCLPSLEMLKLQHCTRLQELTIENLPSSLQQLVVYDYRRTMKEQLKRLREKFPELVIEYRGSGKWWW